MPNKNLSNPQKILFIINPISGDIDKDHLKEEIRLFSEKDQFCYEVFYTTGKNDAQKVKEAIEKYMPDKVVPVGGDGTCNLVGKILIGKNIPMGIIPLGSANGMAKELDIPKKLEDALKVVVQDNKKPIDAININNQYISLHLSDIGLNAQVIKRFEHENIRGFIGYTKSFLKEIVLAKPIKFMLKIDGAKIIRKAYMVVIANASKYGTGAIINSTGKISDGKFEIIIIRPYSFWHLFHMIIPFFTRKIHQLDYIDIYSCKKASIQIFKEKELQIDGEVIGRMKEITVEINPHALKILVPENPPQSIFLMDKLDALLNSEEN